MRLYVQIVPKKGEKVCLATGTVTTLKRFMFGKIKSDLFSHFVWNLANVRMKRSRNGNGWRTNKLYIKKVIKNGPRPNNTVAQNNSAYNNQHKFVAAVEAILLSRVGMDVLAMAL